MHESQTPQITLVIPGRNASRTIAACLDAVVPLLGEHLSEIIFVNDGSTDSTAQIVSKYPVRCIRGEGRGPGAARNLGWRQATTPWVWFIDSDCVAEPHALEELMPQMHNEGVGGIGGSYGNMCPDSLLACLIHEEIIERHLQMALEVNFLATFNVLYRRDVLEQVQGFDEKLKLAQDAELAFRVRRAGHRLRFCVNSRVKHFHPTQLQSYLRTQMRQGYYRVLLYARHPQQMKGDSYSGIIDHVQPPLAMLVLATLPLLLVGNPLPTFGLAGLLFAAQLPLTFRITQRTGEAKYLNFAWMSFLRAFARGIGLSTATLITARDWLTQRWGGPRFGWFFRRSDAAS
ncbi:MAG: glycosyltransferase [Planctomycetales bacterium]|nr:glycosyltransferase [Planctomycetales bacterium]